LKLGFGGAEECQGAVEAGSSSRIGQRSEQDAGGLIRVQTGAKRPCLRPLEPIYGPHPSLQTSGRVAQRESTSLTSRGSQVRSLSRPPYSIPEPSKPSSTANGPFLPGIFAGLIAAFWSLREIAVSRVDFF